VLDLAGNVWEWTRSEYRTYPYDPRDGREERFTLRGGSWFAPPLDLRAAYRLHLAPDDHLDDVGFRLARHPRSRDH
jgi:formylglycine-generating enzyme required for sulfatase activity